MYFHYAHTGMRTGCVPIFHKKYDQAPSLVGCAVQQNLRCEQIHLRMSDIFRFSPMLESMAPVIAPDDVTLCPYPDLHVCIMITNHVTV